MSAIRKPVVFITRKIPDQLLSPFTEVVSFKMWKEVEKPIPRHVFLKEAKRADGVLCLLTEKIDREFLQANTHLKIIANMAVGYDNIDVKLAQELGIVVTNTPDVLTETTADLTFGLLMATARRLIEASDLIRNDAWGDWSPFTLAGTDIHSKTVGIVGMGRIGEAFARRAKGFNMHIIYHNRSPRAEIEASLGATYVSFESLLEQADYVVSLVPFTEETYQLFNREAFLKMKKSAIFINASRGAVVDEEALYDALVQGEITAAGLDVFESEPISTNHPLVGLDNVVLLPHIGSATVATREKMIELCLRNIEHIFKGEAPQTPIM